MISLRECCDLTSVTVLPQLSAREVVTGALVPSVSVGAGVLARPVSVVQQTLKRFSDGSSEMTGHWSPH